jgi:exonuclease III
VSQAVHTCCVVGVVPASALYTSCDKRLLCASSSFRRRYSDMNIGGLLTLLLLCAGVEPNPGPSLQPVLNFAVQNARSVVAKAAHIHDLVAGYQLDLLVITETWMQSDAPSAIQCDTAPSGYQVIHQSRGSSADKRGGGIALVHRDSIADRVLDCDLTCSEFELLIVKLATSPPVTIACIYRPPGNITQAFCNALADLFDQLQLISNHFVVCGDLNSPGDSDHDLHPRVADVLQRHCIMQHVPEATHDEGHLLDVIATPDSVSGLISGIYVRPTCFSDHHTVVCQLNIPHDRPTAVRYSFRDIRRIDLQAFCDGVCQSPLYDFSREQSVDQYVDLFQHTIGRLLDKLAPLKTRTRRLGCNDYRWLSAEAREAKRCVRRLERKYRHTQAAVDKQEWNKAKRVARDAITRSRSSDLKAKFDAVAGDSAAMWRLTRTVLHQNQGPIHSNDDCRALATGFNSFFIDKLHKIQQCVAYPACRPCLDPYFPTMLRWTSVIIFHTCR